MINISKQNKHPLQSIKYLLSLLSLFTLALAQPVFASPDLATTMSAAPSAPSDQGFALVRVSVVRLLVSYQSGGQTVTNCTGLGVLVKSLPVSSGTTMPNDWVLTDGSLVDKTPATCAGQATGTLSQITIYFNTIYNSRVTVKVDSNSTPSVGTAITCSYPTNCSNGPALLAFQGDQVPFVDLAPSSSGNGASAMIGLLNKDGMTPPKSDNKTTDQQTIAAFLIPQSVTNRNYLEIGTLSVNANGRLITLQFAKPVSQAQDDISALINSISGSPSPIDNLVNNNWKAGITAYYQGKYADAQTDFHSAANANPNFQGAKDFEDLAKNKQSVPQQTNGGIVIPGTSISIQWWELIIIILVFLSLIGSLAGLISKNSPTVFEEVLQSIGATKKQPNRRRHKSMFADYQPTLPVTQKPATSLRSTPLPSQTIQPQIQDNNTKSKPAPIETANTVNEHDNKTSPISPKKTLKIFLSYSHKDEAIRLEFETYLKNLKRRRSFIVWHDGDIDAGDEWDKEIKQHLSQADIVLLLISENFMASDYCYNVEMTESLEKHRKGEARVVPIILRPSTWKKEEPLQKLQALPRRGQPITLWPNRDEAFMNVIEGIEKIIDKLTGNEAPE